MLCPTIIRKILSSLFIIGSFHYTHGGGGGGGGQGDALLRYYYCCCSQPSPSSSRRVSFTPCPRAAAADHNHVRDECTVECFRRRATADSRRRRRRRRRPVRWGNIGAARVHARTPRRHAWSVDRRRFRPDGFFLGGGRTGGASDRFFYHRTIFSVDRRLNTNRHVYLFIIILLQLEPPQKKNIYIHRKILYTPISVAAMLSFSAPLPSVPTCNTQFDVVFVHFFRHSVFIIKC